MMRSGQRQPPTHTPPPNRSALRSLRPSCTYTMGGLAVDPSARVLSSIKHTPIPSLWAAGELIAGTHGYVWNRLPGSSLLEAVGGAWKGYRLRARMQHESIERQKERNREVYE
ncbi:hypothetical protein C8R45DRAFT_1030957 [Mycena sanguinolenta]|nr:hypothetical protein C8R45DRAFT_1030957 [Mycena sanguinolenta]